MKHIGELQQNFQHAVVTRTAQPGLFMREPGEGGFDIYANGYRLRLAAALRDNYPVLSVALGDDRFEMLALAYIDAHPSRFRSIRWFGGHLAEFMDRQAGLTPHPSLADLARMDWALRQAFDAADDTPLAVGDLAALTAEAWPLQRFRLCASVALQPLQWCVEPVWHALSHDVAAETAPPERWAHTLLVWRQGLDCQWRSLDTAEAAGLTALAAGESFADIGACMMTSDETMTPTTVATLLRQWIDHGLLAKG